MLCKARRVGVKNGEKRRKTKHFKAWRRYTGDNKRQLFCIIGLTLV